MTKAKGKFKLWIYELLTQMIIILGRLREKIQINRHYRPDRLCAYDWKKWLKEAQLDKQFFGQGGQWGCCDCGLEHFMWIEGDLQCALPIRPKEYKYKMRYLAGKGSYATEEMKKQIKAWR